MSKRLARLLAALAVGLALLGGGLAVAWPAADWLKPRLEVAVWRATGRKLFIGGPLRIGWNLTVDASDVSLANMAGGSRPEMARIGRLHARLAPLPLLHREIRVTNLELVDPRVLVERDASGVVNWRLAKPASALAPSRPESASRASPWRFVLDRLTTVGGTLAWHDARHAAADGQLSLPAIRADFDGASPIPQPAPDGVLEWRSGPLLNLSRKDATPFQAAISLAGATANASGTLAIGAAGLDAMVSASVPDSARLAALAGVTLKGSDRFAMTGHLVATPRRIALDAARLATPAGSVAGDLAWIVGARPSLVGDVTSQRIDLAALRAMATALRPQAPAPPPAATGAPTPVALGTRIIPDRQLPFADLDQLDADVRLRVATLANPDLRDVATRLLLRDGRLTVDPFAANLDGRLDGSLRIDARQPVPAVSVSLHAPSLMLPPLLKAAGLPRVAEGAISVDADVRATGRTPHELAATLTGNAHIDSVDATLDEAALTGLLRAAHLPRLGNSGEMRLRCLVVGVNAVGGQATVSPLLLEAGRLSVRGEGHVDLDTETLAIQLRPMLRTGPGIVIPLRLSGGWRSPKLLSDFGDIFKKVGSESCPAAPGSVSAPAAPPPAKNKPPKPIDILRGLLR